MRAVVELEFFDFIGVAMDQVFNQAAKLHYFTGGRLQVPLVIRVPIVARMGMGPQHSQSLESWFMHIPGLKIAMPAERRRRLRADAHGAARHQPGAVRRERPPLRPARGRRPGRRADPLRRRRAIVREGTRRHRRGAVGHRRTRRSPQPRSSPPAAISVEVIDPRTLEPFDLDTIVASVKKTQHLVVAHDAHKRCGVGAEIAALVVEQAFDYLDAPVERVCGLDVPVPSGPLLTEVYPTAGDIVAAVERSLARSA